EVADGRNRHLWRNQLSAGRVDRNDGLVDRIDADGVGRAGNRSVLAQQSAVDAGFLVIACADHPILHGAWPLLELPAEGFLVKGSGAVGIARWDFKVNDAGHGSLLFFSDARFLERIGSASRHGQSAVAL